MKIKSHLIIATLSASFAFQELNAMKSGWNGSLYWQPSIVHDYKYQLVDTVGAEQGVSNGLFDRSDFKFNWLGVGAGFGYVAKSGFGLSLDFDFISKNLPSDEKYLCVENNGAVTGGGIDPTKSCSGGYGYATNGVSSFGLIASTKYYFFNVTKRIVPFIEFGAGLQNVTYHSDTLHDHSQTENSTLSISDNISAFTPTVMFGLGAVMKCYDHVNLLLAYDFRKSFESDLSSEYTITRKPDGGTGQSAAQIKFNELANHIFKIGVVVNFGDDEQKSNAKNVTKSNTSTTKEVKTATKSPAAKSSVTKSSTAKSTTTKNTTKASATTKK